MTTDERLTIIMTNHREPDLRNCEACFLAAELRRARAALKEILDTPCRAGRCEAIARRGLGDTEAIAAASQTPGSGGAK